MDCTDVRLHLLDFRHGRLRPDQRAGLLAHLGNCAACSRVDAEDQVLTEILERRLPQHPASIALRRRLAAQWPTTPAPTRVWWNRWGASLLPTLAVAVVLLVALPVYFERTNVTRTDETTTMVKEAVKPLFRVLMAHTPVPEL